MDIALFKMKPLSYIAFAELSDVVAEATEQTFPRLRDVIQVAEVVDIAIDSENPVLIERLDLYLNSLSDAQIIFLSFLSDRIKHYRSTSNTVAQSLTKVNQIYK